MKRTGAVIALVCATMASPAQACRSDALNTSRTIVLGDAPGQAYGTFQHAALPLVKGEVVLTFDDGPRPANTSKVLDILKSHCTKATFFSVGELIRDHPDISRAVIAGGHSVGLHAYIHRKQNELSIDNQLADFDQAVAAGRDALGDDLSPFYRFPNFVETPQLLAHARQKGYTIFSGDVTIEDWLPGQSPDMLEARLLAKLKAAGGSGIIVMHDWQDGTVAALPQLLAALKTNGYTVVHIQWHGKSLAQKGRDS